MPSIHQLTRPQRERLNEKVLKLFVEFCQTYFHFTLYDYEIEIARELLSSIFVWPHDVYVKMARQSGKTETLTLLIRCLIVFLEATLGYPLLCGIASPKGEQAKTDVDRIKKSVPVLRAHFQVEDREFNELTVRAYRFGRLVAELYRFSLAPTTTNESKTLNLLVVEESHKCDHKRRSDQLDPMLSSTNGPTWHFGVGCPVQSDYKKGCDRLYPDSAAVWIDVDRVIADRRKMAEKTGDPSHLGYEKLFQRLLNKYGRQNPEIRRNFYLEDTVEDGNFISRERFLTCRRAEWQRKNGVLIPVEDLTFAIDWARKVDYTWAGVMTRNFDLLGLWKIPHVRYEEQITMLLEELRKPRKCLRREEDGREVEEDFTFFDRISTVRCDSTGKGDFPTEYLRDHSGLPMGEGSGVEFTSRTKNEMYTLLEAALFREAGDAQRFTYWQDDPLAGELEDQMTALLREYTGNGEFLSPHAPEEPGCYDDAATVLALGSLGAAGGKIGDILLV